jgi:hypothetical protein
VSGLLINANREQLSTEKRTAAALLALLDN